MKGSSRLGLFICRCGKGISNVVDTSELASRAAGVPGVAFCEEHPSLCLKEGLEYLRETIGRGDMDKVIIAACTPRTHEGIFLPVISSAGIDWRMVEMVDIREGCAWIHAEDPRAATQKAWNLLRMGIARAQLLEPFRDAVLRIHPVALVVGGGPVGMKAAMAISQKGFSVHLIDRGRELGGLLRRISRIYPTNEEASMMLSNLKQGVEGDPNIEVRLSTRIHALHGYVGNFTVCLIGPKGEERLRVGAIILATGAQIFYPKGLYRYGELPNVITQLELERAFKEGRTKDAEDVVFIQCVGSRDTERPYCSAICCPITLKNALLLRKGNPSGTVFVLYRDIMAPGIDLENRYQEAKDFGVRFLRYDPSRPPSIKGEARARGVLVYDVAMGREVGLSADLVVLSTPLVPSKDNKEMVRMLRMRGGPNGFFADRSLMEAGRSVLDGIYTCGSARWPASIYEGMIQAEAVSARAASLFGRARIRTDELGMVPGSGILHAFVNEEACYGCGTCVKTCPYEACTLQQMKDRGISRVDKTRCKGCGSCVAACPSGAIQQVGFTDGQILPMIQAAF